MLIQATYCNTFSIFIVQTILRYKLILLLLAYREQNYYSKRSKYKTDLETVSFQFIPVLLRIFRFFVSDVSLQQSWS